MKIIKQIGIIFILCWMSQIIEYLLPFDFPASVIGIILLLTCLLTGILRIEHIQEKSDFLLSNMAFFFIPAGVSMVNYLDILSSNLWQIFLICSVTTVLTFLVTAYSIKFTMKLLNKRKEVSQNDY